MFFQIFPKNSKLKFVFTLFGVVAPLGCFEAVKKDSLNLSDKEQEKVDEFKAEVELGRNMAGRLLQFYGVVENESVLTYINTIGRKVADSGDFPDRNYMFNILDTPAINAFACPGGYILITLGSIKNARSEAELAMVLGHEIAHVGKKHMMLTLKAMSDKEREEEAKKVDDKAKLSDDPLVITRKRPSQDTDSSAGLVLARYLSGSAGASFSVLQAAKAGMNVILEKGLDKELEFEADQEGVRYAIRAGYEPQGLMTFLTRLEETKKEKNKVDTSILEKTHPKISDRKSHIEALLAKLSAKDIVGAEGKDRFAEKVKNLKGSKK